MDRIIFYSASLINRRERERDSTLENTSINSINEIQLSSVQKQEDQQKTLLLGKQKEIIQTEKQFNNLLSTMRSKPYY